MLTTFTQCNCRVGIPENTKSNSYVLLSTKDTWKFQTNALWDAIKHSKFVTNCDIYTAVSTSPLIFDDCSPILFDS